jgi:hypothetical protein
MRPQLFGWPVVEQLFELMVAHAELVEFVFRTSESCVSVITTVVKTIYFVEEVVDLLSGLQLPRTVARRVCE